MKAIKYDGVNCVHMQENRDNLCYLTKEYCVGFNVKYDGSISSFGGYEMRRCPMYNLDFKSLIGKNLSDKIREVRTNEDNR